MDLFTSEELDSLSMFVLLRDAPILGQILIDICIKTQKMNLQQIENLFRQKNSAIYFIARPIGEVSQHGVVARWPHTGSKEYPYYLYIAVNGKAEADKLLQQLGITFQENFERLKETGMLVKL